MPATLAGPSRTPRSTRRSLGFILELADSVPSPGDAFEVEGYTFRVQSMRGRRIALLRVTAPAPEAQDEDARRAALAPARARGENSATICEGAHASGTLPAWPRGQAPATSHNHKGASMAQLIDIRRVAVAPKHFTARVTIANGGPLMTDEDLVGHPPTSTTCCPRSRSMPAWETPARRFATSWAPRRWRTCSSM